LRGLWPDRNPLRPRSDRAEAAIFAGLLAASWSVARWSWSSPGGGPMTTGSAPDMPKRPHGTRFPRFFSPPLPQQQAGSGATARARWTVSSGGCGARARCPHLLAPPSAPRSGCGWMSPGGSRPVAAAFADGGPGCAGSHVCPLRPGDRVMVRRAVRTPRGRPAPAGRVGRAVAGHWAELEPGTADPHTPKPVGGKARSPGAGSLLSVWSRSWQRRPHRRISRLPRLTCWLHVTIGRHASFAWWDPGCSAMHQSSR